jgi:hypothetical protein
MVTFIKKVAVGLQGGRELKPAASGPDLMAFKVGSALLDLQTQ